MTQTEAAIQAFIDEMGALLFGPSRPGRQHQVKELYRQLRVLWAAHSGNVSELLATLGQTKQAS